jgi:hypothetical protein
MSVSGGFTAAHGCLWLNTMEFIDLSPTPSPSLEQQRDALKKGLGRAVKWARAGLLSDEPILDACLTDQRYDQQCEDNRGTWLWNILTIVGAGARFRDSILTKFQHEIDERNAEVFCELALQYGKTGDEEFKSQLYKFIEKRPFFHSPWLGEEQLLELDGEAAFQFIAKIRGKRLEDQTWDWDDFAVMDRAIKKLGEPRLRRMLDESSDLATKRFGSAWQNARNSPKVHRQSHIEWARGITVDQVIQAAHGADKCYWLRGWGIHADEANTKEIFKRLWTIQDPVVISKLLRVFSNRSMPEFVPRILELCQNADPEVAQRAFVVLAANSHRSIREFALARLESGECSVSVVSLFINNYESGDEKRILDRLTLPDDEVIRHSLLLKITKILEKNATADCSQLGLIAYTYTPCENCRFFAAKSLRAGGVAPEWLIEECRDDSCKDIRALDFRR